MIQTLILRGIDPPYLIVRVVPSLFHVTVLPAHLSEQELTALARAQVRANGFDACLVQRRATGSPCRPKGLSTWWPTFPLPASTIGAAPR